MTSVKVRQMLKAFRSKGFELDNSHHLMVSFSIEGKLGPIRTRISHGAKEYGDNLLAQVAKQLHMSKSQLLEFFECSMTEADYIDLLTEIGEL